MDYKKILFAVILFCLGQTIAWIQVYGYLKWSWLKDNSLVTYLLALPIAYLIVTGTRLCISGFGDQTWPVRILTFTIGFLMFGLLSIVLLKQVPDIKTYISLFLCVVIIVIQFM